MHDLLCGERVTLENHKIPPLTTRSTSHRSAINTYIHTLMADAAMQGVQYVA